MKWTSKFALGILIGAIALVNSAPADDVRIESYTSNSLLQDQVLLHVPPKRPAGLLVLLPAGDIHSYDARSGYTPALLPEMLATNDVMTIIAAPRPWRGASVGLYAGDEILGEMDPVAVFAVDSPLDYERWFIAAELHLERLALAGRDLAEDRNAVNELRKAFGGSPTEAVEAYRRQSPVSTLVADGGNARLLKDTPIRIYIEPDLKWRLENWNQDIYSSNIPDATALINILRLVGNKDAELITTAGAGYRPDGSRNPHSWSIVDERALAQWLIALLRTPNSEK